MNILVTGKNGFIAKNVIEYFGEKHNIYAVSHDEDVLLEEYCNICDFVFHLAAVQRSQNEQDFWEGNVEYTQKLLSHLKKANNIVPILFSTSIGIDKKSIFADTKLEAERLIREYGLQNNIPVYIFKLNHIFGKYGKPNFNNVIATFCNNLANGQPICVNDPSVTLNFTYIDDLMSDFNQCIELKSYVKDEYLYTKIQYSRTIGTVVMILGDIMNNKCMNDDFGEKLFRTYNSYKTE